MRRVAKQAFVFKLTSSYGEAGGQIGPVRSNGPDGDVKAKFGGAPMRSIRLSCDIDIPMYIPRVVGAAGSLETEYYAP